MLISPYTAPQLATEKNAGADKSGTRRKSCTFGIELFGMERAIIAADKTEIKTTRLAGGLLFGYNPRKAGARLKTPAFTLFRPYCP